ncbi:MAG: hypothetical protein JNK89_03560, partial [Saprospiraceae bacterium]|nr:hypothetical protein [Saprospiraceae bacterium]
LRAALDDMPELGILANAARSNPSWNLELEQLQELVWKQLDVAAATARSSAAVARGNQKVYAEVGRVFARFLQTGQETADAQALAEFFESLRPGPPPEGQEYLRRAFRHYHQAIQSPDAKARAEWIFLANIEIGFHEQTRLQPEIAEALDAALPGPAVFARRLAGALSPNWGWSWYLLWRLLGWLGRPNLLDEVIAPLHQAARRSIRLVFTKRLMTMGLPGVRLALGKDLNLPFSPNLVRVENPELQDLLKQVDPSPESLRDSGAVDWADLPDRLHFIADLFRCSQESPELLGPPFSAAQVAALKAGQMPAGEL